MIKFFQCIIFSCLTLLCVTAQVSADGLVAYYAFDQNGIDLSANGNDGIAVNVVAAPDRFGRPGECYYFNGTDAYMAIPSSSSLNPENQLTINL